MGQQNFQETKRTRGFRRSGRCLNTIFPQNCFFSVCENRRNVNNRSLSLAEYLWQDFGTV